MNKRCLLLVLFVALLIFPCQGFCQWSTDPSVNTPVVTAVDIQGSHKIVYDGSGGWFVVWHDNRDGATTSWDIYAQRFNAAGDPQWAANGVVVCNASDRQQRPKVTLDEAGGIIVSWCDSKGSIDDLYAQRLDANGNRQWVPANGVTVIATGRNDHCGWIVPDGSHGAIMMSYDGAVNRITATGTLPWGAANSPVMYSTPGNSWAPKLMSDGAGGAILTWVEGSDIAVQRVVGNGDLLWNSGNPVPLTYTGSGLCPRIISDGSGGAIIMWQDDRSGPLQIYARRVNSGGVAQWTVNGIQVTDASTENYSHGLAPDGAGGVFVTWFDNVDSNLYAQRIDSGGSPVWDPAAQLTDTGDCLDTSDPPRKTVEDGSGGFVTVWVNNSEDVLAQRVNANGAAQWTANGVVLSNAADQRRCPRIEGNGQGGAVAIWADNRNTATSGQDIYMQGIDSQGTPGDPHAAAAAIPTLNEWGIIIFLLLMAGAALLFMRRKQTVA